MPRNIEIKARIERIDLLHPRATAIADRGPVEIAQDDSFFRCDAGRLKLRTLSPCSGELIFYRRADRQGPKESFYHLTPTSEPDRLRETLSLACGQIGRVRKMRTLFLVGRTRIHLDRVEGLGHFLELEVVLEEGNREDWFGSSFIVRLTVISVVALVFFVISQLLRRHPLVNLRLLHSPRFALACFAYLVLGMALMGSIYVLPLYMAQIHNYNALEIGEVLMWMGLPQLLVLPLVPRLVTRIDPRYLVSFGFLVFAISCFMNVNMSADYAGPQLIQSLIVRALGQPFIMVPLSLVATASLTPEEIPSSSTLLNVLRNLGGAFGIAIIATLIDNDTRTHVSQIGSTLAATSIEGQAYLMQLAQTMMAQGAGPEQAQLQARAMLSNTISREAAIMAYNQVFYVMGIFLLVASALMLLLKQPAPRAPDAEPVEA